jgi:hypothetical protein
MSEQKAENPVEKIKEDVLHAARAESAPAPVRHYRAVLFQRVLVLMVAAFAVDLQITRAIQMVNFPFFTLSMSLIS